MYKHNQIHCICFIIIIFQKHQNPSEISSKSNHFGTNGTHYHFLLMIFKFLSNLFILSNGFSLLGELAPICER